MHRADGVRAVEHDRSAGEGFAVLRRRIEAQGDGRLNHRLYAIRAQYPQIAVRGLRRIKLAVPVINTRQLRPNAHRLADVSLADTLRALEKAMPFEREARRLTIAGARLDWVDGPNTHVITGILDASSQQLLSNERQLALEALEWLKPNEAFSWPLIPSDGISLGTLPRLQLNDRLDDVDATLQELFATPAQLTLGPMQAILADHSKPTRPQPTALPSA